MNENIYEIAKVIASSEQGSLFRYLKRAGFNHHQTPVTRSLAEALLAVWDGKASTLDQASAWKQLWKYLIDADLVSERQECSEINRALTAIDKLVREVYAPHTRGHTIGYAKLKVGDAALDSLVAGSIKYSDKCASDAGMHPDLTKALLNVNSAVTGMRSFDTSNQQDELVHAGVIMLGKALEKVVLYLDGQARCQKSDEVLAEWGTKHPGIAYVWKTPDAYDNLAVDFARLCHEVKDIPHRATRRVIEELAAKCRDLAQLKGLPYAHGVALRPAKDPFPMVTAVARAHGIPVRDWGTTSDLSWMEYDNQPAPEAVDAEAVKRFAAAVERLSEVVEPDRLDVMKRLLVLQDTCYGLAYHAGWWEDLETGEDVRDWPRKHFANWVSAKLMLTVTEVAEAMEGHRKGLMDDKLPNRPMLEVELADAVIRIMDLAGGLNLDVGGAIVEKLAYNLSREDHQIENRKAAGGKSI